jgi:hypothetical protein
MLLLHYDSSTKLLLTHSSATTTLTATNCKQLVTLLTLLPLPLHYTAGRLSAVAGAAWGNAWPYRLDRHRLQYTNVCAGLL